MKHILSFSGGTGSFAAAEMVISQHGYENVLFVFCDTLIECNDLYRFMIESAYKLTDRPVLETLTKSAEKIPPLDNPDRTAYIKRLAAAVMADIPQFVWLIDGRDPWQVYRDRKYQGNTRMAHCTVELKGKTFAKWLTKTFKPEECVIHFGFDWSEEHRLTEAQNNWAPYRCEAVLCGPPFISKAQINNMIDDRDIELPVMYEKGFMHNNCGGFCPKAGQAHYANLLEKSPDVYAYHENQQQQLFKDLPTARAFIRVTRNKQINYLTLKEFREHLQSGGEFIAGDNKGCGCFSDASACGLTELIQ